MNLYRIIPPPAHSIDLMDDAQRGEIVRELTPPVGPWVRAVMVTTSAGAMSGPDGTSNSMTRGADRTLLALHREVADTVLVGASTIKQERVPVPVSTPLVVVTASGDLRGHQLVHAERGEIVVLTNAGGAPHVAESLSGVSHRVVMVESGPVFSAEIIADALRTSLGANALLIEGGQALYETFAPVTDEVALSVTPPPLHDRAGIPPWWPGETDSWTLAALTTDDEKMLYYRYLTGARGAPS